jgi:PhnB protein
MRVMVMVKATKSSEAGELPSEQLLTDMGRFNEELVKAGIMKAGDGLKPGSEAVRVQSYLFFSGRCEEALSFYEDAVSARVTMKMRFSESPDPVPDGMLQAGFEDKIMHASFIVGKMTIMASDGCDEKSKFDGFRLALSVPTAAAADSAFNALAEGGKVDMPLMQTFWSPRYGMLTDKFGVGWMVMVPEEVPCENERIR